MAGHKHANLMAEYAKDAATHEKPWELWEWWDYFKQEWCALKNHPKWDETLQYRRKPEQSDLEKYGVEVGDVWVNSTGEDYFVFTVMGKSCIIREMFKDSYTIVCETEALKTLKFRRGVVDKL